jgi:MFS family permease
MTTAATPPTDSGALGTAGVLESLRAAPPAAKALLAGVFVNKLGGFLQLFVVLYLVHRGFSAVAAGSALGAYGLGSVLGVLAGGWLSDRLGRRGRRSRRRWRCPRASSSRCCTHPATRSS